MKNFFGIVKLGFILTAYAVVACVGLAFVYASTAVTIEERKAADAKTAMQEIFPDADTFKPLAGIVSATEGVAFSGAWSAVSGSVFKGLLIEASGPSYSGKTRILVGITSDGKIAAIKILENKDTPGLGANAASASYYVDKASKTTFSGQFKGKSASDPFEARKDVVCITASTITSRSIALIVRAAAVQALPALASRPSGGF